MKGNKYKIHGDYAEMIINSKVFGYLRILIDKEDVLEFSKYTWYFAKSKDRGYVQSKINNRNIKLHRYLMKEYSNEVLIDHINRNTLDNRKHNLRIADYQKNSFNKGIRSDNTSGIVGVDYNKIAKKWRAKIKYNNVDIHLGYFKNINEALINRRIEEEYLFKEFKPKQAESYINVETHLFIKAQANVMERISKKVS